MPEGCGQFKCTEKNDDAAKVLATAATTTSATAAIKKHVYAWGQWRYLLSGSAHSEETI